MSSRILLIRAYKDITLQQLRSFCETVRMGSLTAAADSLGLARPTVWKQVHALERHLGMKLLEPHARGCRPTESGTALVKLASPMVTGIGSRLQRGAGATLTTVESHVRLAATSWLFLDDMPPCARNLEHRFPHARLTLNEMNVDQVPAAVRSELADLGFAASGAVVDETWLVYEPATNSTSFSLHRQITHLPASGGSARPIWRIMHWSISSSFADPEICQRLEKLRLAQTQPRRVEASSYAAIRRYVALGYGIGLVAVSVLHQRDPSFHERSMSHELGRLMVYSIQRRGALQGEAHREFLKIALAKLTFASPRTGMR